LISNVRYYRT